MRKTRLLAATGLGIWLGWRARGSMASMASFRAVGRRESDGYSVTRSLDGIDPGEMIEKARALIVLGRERGRDLLRLVISNNRAA